MKIILTLLLLWSGHFLVDFMIAVFPIYKTLAGVDLAVAGIAVSACALLGEGAQLFFGAWSDRGYRQALIAFGVVSTCAVLGVVFSSSAAGMLPWLFLTYLGSAAFHPAAAGLVGSLSQHRKGVLIAIFASGGSFGLAAGQLALFQVYEALGQGVILLAVPSLFLALVLFLVALPKTDSGSRKPISLQAMGRLFASRELRLLYIALVCNTTVFFGLMFLLPDLLLVKGFPNWVCFGCGHLAMVLGGACMMVPSGYLADRYSARQVILYSMIFGLALLGLFLFVPLSEPSFVLGALFFLGALLGIVHPIGVALANRYLPSHPGLVSAFAMGMVWVFAESLGPATGLLTKLFSPEEGVISALAILSLLNIIGSIAAWSLPKQVEEGGLLLDFS